MAKNKATNSVVLKGVRNGDATCVAIIVAPSGSCAISGSATLVKITCANGTRQMKINRTATLAFKILDRNSTRWEISVASSRSSSASSRSSCRSVIIWLWATFS
jgi:hypothetical protein